MSGFRNYSTWNRGGVNSNYTGSSSTKSDTSSSKYTSSSSRSAAEQGNINKISSRLSQQYNPSLSSNLQNNGKSSNSGGYLQSSKDTTDKGGTKLSSRSSSLVKTEEPLEQEKSEKSLLCPTSYNRIYPSSYSRSISRERTTDSTILNSISAIPKTTGRFSTSKDNLGLASKHGSKEDLNFSKYKPVSRATSREDLDCIPKQYINSRFLPKNTIEKSQTAYTRSPATRIISTQRESSRKNRELVHLINAQIEASKEKKTTKSYDASLTNKYIKPTTNDSKNASITIQDIKRQTDTQKGVEKKSSVKSETGIPEISTSTKKSLRLSSPLSSASLNSHYLKNNESKNSLGKSDNSCNETSSSGNHISSQKKTCSKSKSYTPICNKRTEKFSKISNYSSPEIPNKDFRKSILNTNSRSNSNHCYHNNSVSSADSELDGEATDISENLSSCQSFHKPDSVESNICTSTMISPTASSNNNTYENFSESKISPSSVTLSISNSENLHKDKHLKPPKSPKLKADVEAKSFLIKALTPVTNLFKVKYQYSDEKINWMDNDSENSPDVNKESKVHSNDSKNGFSNYSDGKETYVTYNKDSSSSNIEEHVKCKTDKHKNVILKKIIPRVESGEKPWWLDKTSEVPDGIVVYAVEEIEQPQSSLKNEIEKSANESPNRYQLRHIDSGEKPWWLNSTENISEVTTTPPQSKREFAYKVTRQSSGKVEWWLGSSDDSKHSSQDNVEVEPDIDREVLGDRASPEGLEMPKQNEFSSVNSYTKAERQKPSKSDSLFISRHKNIDDILGSSCQSLSPVMSRIFSSFNNNYKEDEYEEITPDQVKIHDGNNYYNSARNQSIRTPNRIARLDDASLQLYKDGDYGSYLDLEASISEQQEEFEDFQSNKKNSIVLRTQLSVRVHTIIEKLLTSEGRELRRALFSLKQIFQEDKDLVHEFVQNDGLACLIKVGSEADQNYQNYILRALGQVMLYVDGMNGVMQHNETVQWLYSLISSKFRLVVKTALKLLLVFVEYVDTNCMLLIKAVHSVDTTQNVQSWYNIMKLLKDFDSADTELLIYAMTLINKCFNGIPDQDTYYDQADLLEEQGIEEIIQRYMSKPGTDLDLLQQFQIYESVLQYEDSEEKVVPLRHLDESVQKTLKSRKSIVVSNERRKSRRHSTGNTSFISNTNLKKIELSSNIEDEISSSSHSSAGFKSILMNSNYKENIKASEAGVTPALKRRRERSERQRSFMKEQQETVALFRESQNVNNTIDNYNHANCNDQVQQKVPSSNILLRNPSRKDLTPLLNAVNKFESDENNLAKQPWITSTYNNLTNEDSVEDINEDDRKILLQLKKENTVKDLTQKLTSQPGIHNPSEDSKISRIGDMSGLISKAKEGLAKSKSKVDVKSPTSESIPKFEVKKSENELRWEELMGSLNRPLNLCDLDFTDLVSDDEVDVLAPISLTNGIPPPPPPLLSNIITPPPPPPNNSGGRNTLLVPPGAPTLPNSGKTYKSSESRIPIKKNKKTVKLFWKEVRDDINTSIKLKTSLIWDELTSVAVDTQKLEHLFESRAKDLITKKQQELNKNREIIVLDPKRSNAINIGMTKLPPPRSIKTAILKMDSTIMNREGIEKLLTMLPTEEERTRIQEAQSSHPDLPLGSAEQFLLTLASISELPARLNLWAFKLDFENSEREIAEPLMDLKQGIEVLKVNKTFRYILGTLLSIGIFLNGVEVKGFQVEYLIKVPEVKDTVHKHSLLHHLCHIVMEKFSESTDLYSEIGSITRASKVDFDDLALNIQRLELDCKASWDHLKLIAKHDGSTMMKVKMSDFLGDCAERIILLNIIHRRVINRFHKFLLWLGIPLHQVADTKPNEFCKIISEFALEYRTTRERVIQQLEKKANHRERNKTRGKMITEIGNFRTKEDRADAELRQLLGSDISDVESLQGTLTWRRRNRDTKRSFINPANGNLTDGDDEILESLVKTATKATSRTAPRERKRTRHADRKSLKRSRTRENNPFGTQDSP